MKELISKFSLTALLLFYMFFCGTLYLISYWSTFDLDVTNYIDVLDIPKSFVYPLTTAMGISLFTFFIQAISNLKEKVVKDSIINESIAPKLSITPTRTLLKRIFTDFSFWTLLILFTCYMFYKPRREWVISIACLILTLFAVVTFVTSKNIIKKIPVYNIRLLLAMFIFFVPIFSFMIGKTNAISIWKNRRYYQVSNIKTADSSDIKEIVSTKLLGKLGHYLFLADSLNSKIIFLNLEEIKTIEYKLINSEK